MVSVDTVALQPFTVVVEVVADRPDQRGVTPEHPDGEGDVAGHPAAVDHQVVNEEAERNFLQVVGEQLFGEPAREPHQMVSCNGTGHRDRHEKSTLRFLSSAS
jgi:hypothetical protein